MPVFIQYLRLRPLGLKSKAHVYSAYFKGFFIKVINPKKFTNIGQFLSKDSVVRYDGMLLYARARTEDIGLYAHSAKPYTFNWFKPSSGEIVVDCGSSVGLFTMIALKAGSVVYAFEANPLTFATLAKNIDINGFAKKAHLFNLGLSNEPGVMTLYAPRYFTASTSFEKKWAEGIGDKDYLTEFKVNMTTLDHTLAKVVKIDWLLIDVESLEYRLLVGANDTLKKTRKIIVEISHNNRDKVKGILDDQGFVEREAGSAEKSAQYYLYERV